MRLAVVLIVLFGSACDPGSPGLRLALTASFDSSVDDAALARVTQFVFSATGDEIYTASLPLARPALRDESLYYVPAQTARSLAIAVTALDAGGQTVASGASSMVTLDPKKTTPLEVTLSAGGLVDLGVPQDGGDLADGGADACPGFCDNFDDRTTVLGAWSNLQGQNGGSASVAAISSAESVSAPHALTFHAPGTTSGLSVGASLTVDRPLPAPKLILDLDVKIVGYTGGSGVAQLLGIYAGGQYAGGFELESLSQVALDYFVQAPDGGINHPTHFFNVQDGAWHHVHFEETFDVSAGSVYITYDSAVGFNLSNVQTWAAGPLPTTLSLWLGVEASHQTGTFDVYFDNVVLR